MRELSGLGLASPAAGQTTAPDSPSTERGLGGDPSGTPSLGGTEDESQKVTSFPPPIDAASEVSFGRLAALGASAPKLEEPADTTQAAGTSAPPEEIAAAMAVSAAESMAPASPVADRLGGDTLTGIQVDPVKPVGLPAVLPPPPRTAPLGFGSTVVSGTPSTVAVPPRPSPPVASPLSATTSPPVPPRPLPDLHVDATTLPPTKLLAPVAPIVPVAPAPMVLPPEVLPRVADHPIAADPADEVSTTTPAGSAECFQDGDRGSYDGGPATEQFREDPYEEGDLPQLISPEQLARRGALTKAVAAGGLLFVGLLLGSIIWGLLLPDSSEATPGPEAVAVEPTPAASESPVVAIPVESASAPVESPPEAVEPVPAPQAAPEPPTPVERPARQAEPTVRRRAPKPATPRPRATPVRRTAPSTTPAGKSPVRSMAPGEGIFTARPGSRGGSAAPPTASFPID